MNRTIHFPIDSANRQLIARKRDGVWTLIERDTTRKNAITILPSPDQDMIDDLERIKQ